HFTKKLSKERLALLKKLYLKGELSMVFHQYLPVILKSIKDDNVECTKKLFRKRNKGGKLWIR
ncbi:unnamed protein product, partial [marine sediment metagenome]